MSNLVLSAPSLSPVLPHVDPYWPLVVCQNRCIGSSLSSKTRVYVEDTGLGIGLGIIDSNNQTTFSTTSSPPPLPFPQVVLNFLGGNGTHGLPVWSPGFTLGTQDFMQEYLINFPGLPTGGALWAICNQYTNPSHILYLFESGGTVFLEFDYSTNGSSGIAGTSYAWAPGPTSWYWLVFQRVGSTGYYMIADAVTRAVTVLGTTPITGSIIASGDNLWFGARSNGGSTWQATFNLAAQRFTVGTGRYPAGTYQVPTEIFATSAE